MWAWNYPTINEEYKSVITRKYNSQLEMSNAQSFTFAQYGQKWFYICNSDVIDSEKLKKVNSLNIYSLYIYCGIHNIKYNNHC